MSLALTGETIAYLMSLGLTPDQMKGLVDRLQRDALAMTPPAAINGVNEETERHRNESTYAERKRKRDRERRQAERDAFRAAKEAATAGDRPATAQRPPATVEDQGGDTGDAAPRTCAQVVTLTSSLRSEAYPPVKPNGLTAPKGAETVRGTRIPESFCPDLEAAEKAGLTLAQAAVEADKFLDYWRAVPGAKGRKTDWPATWRNWCRSAVERNPRKAHERPGHNPQQPTAREDRLGRMLAGAMAAVDERTPKLG